MRGLKVRFMLYRVLIDTIKLGNMMNLYVKPNTTTANESHYITCRRQLQARRT